MLRVLIFQQENVNEPISAKKRKCTLEITAYSWDYSAKQRCGLASVRLIYSAAPHLPPPSLQQQHSLARLPRPQPESAET